jgi:hypothetical protein
MKNLNEQINRMKSLMSEDRLFGNLVDKKPINEWPKAAKLLGVGDDVLKVGVRNSDEAVEVINKAVKYFDDANIAVKYSDEMIKSVDDIATDFVKPINSSTELISHYKKYEPIYKYLYKDTPKKLKNYESYLKALESGTVTDLTMMVKGKPLFAYLPEGVNIVSLKNYLNELPEELAKKKIKHIQKSYRDYFKGKYMEVLDTGDDAIGGSVGKGDDAIGGTTKGGDDAIGGTTKGGDDAIGGTTKGGDDLTKGGKGTSSGGKVPTIKVASPKQLLERVEEIIGKGYVGEMVVVTEKGEAKIIVGEFDSAKGLIEASLDDLTKGMSRRQKNKFIKYFMENGGEEIEKNLSKKYFSKENVIKFLKAGIGDYGPKGNLYVGDPIGLPASIYYTFRDGELTHPFLIKDGGYYGKLEKSLEDMGLFGKAVSLALETICKNGEEATDNVFDCKEFPAIILKRSQDVTDSMECLPEGSTTEEYRKHIWEKINNNTLSSLIYKNQKDRNNNSQKFQDNKSLVVEYIDKYLGVFGESETWFDISDDVIASKILECNKKRIKDNEDSDEKQGYEWDEMKSSDDNQKPGGGGSQGTELPQF